MYGHIGIDRTTKRHSMPLSRTKDENRCIGLMRITKVEILRMENPMKSIASSTAFCAAALVVAAACLCLPGKADVIESGQRVFGQTSVEPALDDSTGNLIYLLTPLKSPLPSK